MPRCVTTKKLTDLTKHEDPDVAAVAQELVRARKKLAEYRAEGRVRGSRTFSWSHLGTISDSADFG